MWRDVRIVATSPEPKARQTAEPLAEVAGAAVRIERDLREVGRGATWVVGAEQYIDIVRRYFAGEPLAGWEPLADAQGRVVACIQRLASEGSGPLCAVSHGLALSLYVAWLAGRAAPSVDEWRSIPLPGIAVVDRDFRRAMTPFLSVEEFLGREAPA